MGARDRLAGTVTTGPTWRVPGGPPLPGATAQASWLRLGGDPLADAAAWHTGDHVKIIAGVMHRN
jgi:hypothetical protein